MILAQGVVKFGTDGWRGVIADDFTYENVRVAARAIALYCLRQPEVSCGVCVGWDTRFGSRSFARVVAEVLAEAGISVWMSSHVTPTPELSFAVRTRGAAGGVMITSSHNPPEWNGVKFKASYGGSGLPSTMSEIEGLLGEPAAPAEEPAAVTEVDFRPEYVAALERFVDLGKVRRSGFRFLIDPMWGAGQGYLAEIFGRAGVPFVAMRSEVNPAFPGINPEPIQPHLALTCERVVAEGCDAGLVTDGDADRVGAVDERGRVVDAHKIFAVLLDWLLRRKGWAGDVTRAVNTTGLIDRIAARHGRRLHEHGIGFKYVCELMLEHEILIGGEESGSFGIPRHLMERDGLLNCLLLAEVMADEGKPLGEIVDGLEQEYGVHRYARLDLRIPEAMKQGAVRRAHALQVGDAAFAGMPIQRIVTLDGVKFYLENPECTDLKNAAETWLLLRASGTEPLLRVYCESCSEQSVRAVLTAAERFVREEA